MKNILDNIHNSDKESIINHISVNDSKEYIRTKIKRSKERDQDFITTEITPTDLDIGLSIEEFNYFIDKFVYIPKIIHNDDNFVKSNICTFLYSKKNSKSRLCSSLISEIYKSDFVKVFNSKNIYYDMFKRKVKHIFLNNDLSDELINKILEYALKQNATIALIDGTLKTKSKLELTNIKYVNCNFEDKESLRTFFYQLTYNKFSDLEINKKDLSEIFLNTSNSKRKDFKIKYSQFFNFRYSIKTESEILKPYHRNLILSNISNASYKEEFIKYLRSFLKMPRHAGWYDELQLVLNEIIDNNKLNLFLNDIFKGNSEQEILLEFILRKKLILEFKDENQDCTKLLNLLSKGSLAKKFYNDFLKSNDQFKTFTNFILKHGARNRITCLYLLEILKDYKKFNQLTLSKDSKVIIFENFFYIFDFLFNSNFLNIKILINNKIVSQNIKSLIDESCLFKITNEELISRSWSYKILYGYYQLYDINKINNNNFNHNYFYMLYHSIFNKDYDKSLTKVLVNSFHNLDEHNKIISFIIILSKNEQSLGTFINSNVNIIKEIISKNTYFEMKHIFHFIYCINYYLNSQTSEIFNNEHLGWYHLAIKDDVDLLNIHNVYNTRV